MDQERPFRFKVGDELDPGRRIAFIYGHSPIWLVYEDANGDIQWHTSKDELSLTELEVHRCFDRLYSAIRVCVAEARRKEITGLLASAFYMALSQSEVAAALKHFDEVETSIKAEAEGRLRLYYVGSSAVAMIVVASALGIAIAWTAHANAVELLIGACAASVGAWTSVLQRTSTLTMIHFDPPHYIAIQGVSRILIGAIFGAVFVIAAKAGLFLTVAAENVWAMVTFSFIAGISERFVPELLGRIENRDEKTESA